MSSYSNSLIPNHWLYWMGLMGLRVQNTFFPNQVSEFNIHSVDFLQRSLVSKIPRLELGLVAVLESGKKNPKI